MSFDYLINPKKGINELEEALKYTPLKTILIEKRDVPNLRGYFNYACLDILKRPIYIGRTIDLCNRLVFHNWQKKDVKFYWIVEFEFYHEMI